MSSMKEALEKALDGKKPDPALTEMVGKVIRAKTERDRYVTKITENRGKWIEACDAWYKIGEDYSLMNASLSERQKEKTAIRKGVSVLLPLMIEWETDGIIHLLHKLNEGLGKHREPVSGSHVQTFIKEFKKLLNLEKPEADNLDQFLLGQQNPIGYTKITDVFPPLAKWIQISFPIISPHGR